MPLKLWREMGTDQYQIPSSNGYKQLQKNSQDGSPRRALMKRSKYSIQLIKSLSMTIFNYNGEHSHMTSDF